MSDLQNALLTVAITLLIFVVIWWTTHSWLMVALIPIVYVFLCLVFLKGHFSSTDLLYIFVIVTYTWYATHSWLVVSMLPVIYVVLCVILYYYPQIEQTLAINLMYLPLYIVYLICRLLGYGSQCTVGCGLPSASGFSDCL
jgi:hypothetical protein